ncbi:MAG: 50S ribosomal protein L24 [Nanoarchaeota archaeon]
MKSKRFSTHWNSSVKARKQHKYRANAPLHVKQKLLHVHLSSELRKKHNTRAAQVRKGDKVKVLRGKFKGQEGKVERVNLKREQVFIGGMDYTKKNGSKVPLAFHPSKIMIVSLEMNDKRRKFGKDKLNAKKNKSPEENKK